ncbi:MAG: hypothetical protein ACR2QQ_16000 [Gammaproteobacteria bacterium]
MATLSFARGITPRIREDGVLRAIYFVLARFQFVRLIGNAVLTLIRPAAQDDSVPSASLCSRQSLFSDVNPDEAVAAIREKSWFPNFNLRPELADEITLAAKDALLVSPMNRTFAFHPEDRSFAEQYLGQPIVFADYPDLVVSNRVIRTICADPAIRLIAEKYLRRRVQHIKPRLFHSFIAKVSHQERLKQLQTIHFHYDSDAFRVLSFNFYLTDTDEDNGAHVLIEGTHGKKHLRHLFGTTNVPHDDVSKFYPERKITVISGRKGYGFAEDLYCLHKALIPRTRNRLFLQIRCY